MGGGTHPMSKPITSNGNVIYQRTRWGWFGSLGVWAVLLALSIVLLMSTLPAEAPYFDTAVAGLMTLATGWRVLLGSRHMLVAIGKNHLQYIGLGRAWYFYFKDLAGVDLADQATMFSLPMLWPQRKGTPIPRYAIFVMRKGNRAHIRLTFFDASALLKDLDKRLPGTIERGERYRKTLKAIKREA
jgi:hypothetical protein